MHSQTMRYVRGVAVCLMSCIVACSVLPADASDFSCEIRTDRPANAYIVGKPIQMAVYADSPRVELCYSVTDHEGVRWETRRLWVSATAPALLELHHALPTGVYTVALDKAGQRIAEEVICVVPDPDEGIGDGRVFGVNHKPTTDEEWDALTIMGVRTLRTEFSWPAVESVQGQYDFSLLDYTVANARQRGLRLIILTGHTPKFYSMKPVDAEGRVASAWFTWAPADTRPWFEFVNAIGGRVLGQKLAPAVDARDEKPQGMSLPLVAAWEVWSEADQNFYYGDWNRYLDMLRVAYCSLKSHDARVPVVYGSCGHWTPAAYTVQSRCEDYFDLAAHHPGGTDPGQSLAHWYINMPQVFIKPGKPRESAFTECYYHPTDPAREAGFQLRLFATFKSRHEKFFIRSGCMGGVIGRPDQDFEALLWRQGDKLIPREPFVAWSVARWLLEDAFYVGPLDGPEGAQLELFVKHGSPMVVAWADRHQSVKLWIGAGAQVMDHMGRVSNLSGSSHQLQSGPDAIALRGVGWGYIAEAMRAATELRLTTDMGFVPERNSGYIDPLEQDAALAIRAGFADELRRALDSAADAVKTSPASTPKQLYAAQRLAGEGMVVAAQRCQETNVFSPLARNVIWRLAQYTEELGLIADGVGQRWEHMNNVSDADIAKVVRQSNELRTRVRSNRRGAECAFAERLLDRAAEQLDSVRLSNGHNRGAWWSALTQVRAAHASASVEPAILRRVFAVADFPTSDAVTKGTLIPPSPDHRVAVRVYNFLDEPVSGSLQVLVPDEWSGPKADTRFFAPAGGCSQSIPVEFEVPTDPKPWVTRMALRPCGELQVQLPEPLPTNTDLWLTGQVDNGSRLPDMKYRLCVGQYRAVGEEAHLASR